jgi:hypothetical protein
MADRLHEMLFFHNSHINKAVSELSTKNSTMPIGKQSFSTTLHTIWSF